MYIFNFDDLLLVKDVSPSKFSMWQQYQQQPPRQKSNLSFSFFSSLCIHLEQCNSTKSLKRGSVNNVDVEVGPNKS